MSALYELQLKINVYNAYMKCIIDLKSKSLY